MVELTEREKVIILELGIMFNPQIKAVPFNLKVLALKTLLETRNISISEDELKDISVAIEKEQQDSISEGFGFLNKHKEIGEALKDFKF